MNLNEIVRVGDAIALIAEEMDVTIPEIVYSLIGCCFTPEQAREILRYHQEDPE